MNPSHTYSQAGTYIACLDITSSLGCRSIFCDTVVISGSPVSCNASYSYTASGNVATFTNTSTPASGLSYSWDFGDGSAASTQTNPIHTYSGSGFYYVTLTATGPGITPCTFSDTVVITQSNTPCSASYTVVKDSSVAFGVILYNTSTNAASHSYSWDFGDGTTGSGRIPTHQYQSFGDYVVCLTISDSLLNCTSTFCDTVGMDTLGNLKVGFGLIVQDALTVGINEEVDQLNTIRLYPNPATDAVSLDLRNTTGSLNIKVLDLSGRVILERKNNPSGNIESFDVSGLEGGIYFMLLDDGNSQRIEKFIKSK